ncbi:MAG: ABC transporter permease [Chloroflexota bacterium]
MGRRRFGLTPANLGALGILALLWIVFGLTVRGFATPANFWNIARQAAVLALAAFGQTFAIIAGGIDISVGGIVAAVSSVTALAALRIGTIPGFAMGLLAGAALGAISGFFIARFRVQPVIATIAMLSFSRGFGFQISSGQPTVGMPEGFSDLGSGYLGPIPTPAILAVVVMLLLHYLLTNTSFGRALFAIGSNEEAARLGGINVTRYKMLAFAMSGLLAGFASIVLTSRANSGQPTLGQGMELETIAAVVIGGTSLGGGVGGVLRTLVGVLIIASLGNAMNLASVSPYLQQVVIGLAIIVAVLLDNLQKSRVHKNLFRRASLTPQGYGPGATMRQKESD